MTSIVKYLIIFGLSIYFIPVYIYAGQEEKNIEDTVRIIGVGDIMFGTAYPSEQYLPPFQGKRLLDDVKSILADADVTFGNLEGSFLDSGEPVKICKDPSKCYAFRMPESYVHILKDAQFDVVNLANNHVGDFGDSGRKKTVDLLKMAGIHFAGLLNFPYSIFEKNGVTYGVCGFSPNVGTPNINDIPNAVRIVKELTRRADIVIVSFHGGAEGADNRHVTKANEIFYGENRGNVYEFAHKVIDAGADVVIGHGPHVTRAVELYKNRFIAYSLGNFCTYGRFNLKGPNGVAPIIKVYLHKNGEFVRGKIYPIKQDQHGVKIDGAARAIKEIQELTRHDFPNTPLHIQDDGEIQKLP